MKKILLSITVLLTIAGIAFYNSKDMNALSRANKQSVTEMQQTGFYTKKTQDDKTNSLSALNPPPLIKKEKQTELKTVDSGLKESFPDLYEKTRPYRDKLDSISVLQLCETGFYNNERERSFISNNNHPYQQLLLETYIDICQSPDLKEFISTSKQEYESFSASDEAQELLEEAHQEIKDPDIRQEAYNTLIQGLLGDQWEFYTSALIFRMRKDLQDLNRFMMEMGYGFRPGPGGDNFLEVDYVMDASRLIRCSAYPQECAVHSPLMNQYCLFDQVACDRDYISYLHLTVGTQRTIATFGVANYALTQAGYPILQYQLP